jgi:hypothetical protein
MHNLALIYAEEAIRLANEDVMAHRRALRERPSSSGPRWPILRSIAGAISDLPRVMTLTVEQAVTPTLTDYPYRAH